MKNDELEDDKLERAFAEVSGSGTLPFNLRQFWYAYKREGSTINWEDFRKAIKRKKDRSDLRALIAPELRAPRDGFGVPYHAAVMYLPGQPPQESERTYPTGKAKGKFYCKYCYSTHRDWWQMNAKDYGERDVLLCGKCGHTSLKEHTLC